MIRTQTGTHNRSETVAVLGTPLRYLPVTLTVLLMGYYNLNVGVMWSRRHMWVLLMFSIHVLRLRLVSDVNKTKAVPLYATKALGWRGGITPTHSRRRH
jgi:hypothetical protein